MNPKLKALLAQLQTKSARLSEITALGESATDENLVEAKALAGEIKGLRTQEAELREILDVEAGTRDWLGKAAPTVDTGTRTERTGKRVGTDLVGSYEFGNARLDHEGFELSDKQFFAMQEDEYLKAFGAYMRKGAALGRTHGDVLDRVAKMQGGLDSAGGVLVPPQIIMEIVRRDPALTTIKDLVRTVPTSSDRIIFPALNYTGNAADDANGDIYANPLRIQRGGETQNSIPGTRPEWGTIEIPIHEAKIEVPVTRGLLEDAAVPIMSLIAEMMNESYRLDSVRELTVGNGLSQPEGFTLRAGATGGAPIVNIGNAVTGDGLIDLFYSLPSQYRANATLVVNETNVYRTWAKIKDADQNYIFGLGKTIDGGLATARQEVYLGRPIAFDPFMADGGAGALVAAFGDFRKAYYYGLRLAMTLEMQMLPRDAFAYGVFRFRDGGKLAQPRAIRIGRQQ